MYVSDVGVCCRRTCTSDVGRVGVGLVSMQDIGVCVYVGRRCVYAWLMIMLRHVSGGVAGMARRRGRLGAATGTIEIAGTYRSLRRRAQDQLRMA